MSRRRFFSRIAWGLAFTLAAALLAHVPDHPSSEAAAPLVCLDPGHGGSAPGAVNDSLREAEINLDVANALAGRLAADGIDSVLTRTDDSTKSARDRYEFCNAQNATILVSVHTNSVSDPSVDGTLAIYFHNDDRALAQVLHDAMWSELRPTAPDPGAFRDFGLRKDALGVLLKSDMPAATVEPVFLSHPGEAARLAATVSDCPNASDNLCRRAQIVEAGYIGIVEYLASPPGDGGDGEPNNGQGKGPPEGRGR
ncbi:MAG: N-acetylmuramoyl-L-alanine amidase [Planctomycetes bacterium]|nr:N-acetylmuramoyl-L-alanine amidase [Planctomycetota bacterium]